jgi:YggT family protein
LSIVFQVIYLVLQFMLLALVSRLMFSYVLQFSRRWRPGRGAAATMELVWSVTDPPLKPLRRVIPPLRVGGASLDLSFIVLWLILVALSILVRKNF